MAGRAFLDVARELVTGATEFHWRTAVVDAYYALFLECRDALYRWGFRHPRRDSIHAWVRLRFTYTTEADARTIGDTLDELVLRRNAASYNLTFLPFFADNSGCRDAMQSAADGLALLDGIEADPVRRAAIIASIRP